MTATPMVSTISCLRLRIVTCVQRVGLVSKAPVCRKRGSAAYPLTCFGDKLIQLLHALPLTL